MKLLLTREKFDRAGRLRVADAAAVLVAVSLPWSTSATGILLALWLLALVFALDFASVRRELMMAAGALPAVLVGLGALGVLWADVTVAERADGLVSFLKLLAIPLLMAQFGRSDRGWWVLAGFLASATVLLAASYLLALLPGLTWRGKQVGIPVKDYIVQSGIFAICVFVLLDLSFSAWREKGRTVAVTLIVIATLFVLNIAFVATSRTTLIIIPVLFLLLGIRRLRTKEMGWFLAVGIVLVAIAWTSSPYLRFRVGNLITEVRVHQATGVDTSAGARLEFWKASLKSVADSPIIGHGTGSIREMFGRNSGSPVEAATNPHNQILAIGIQLGLVGIAVLIAMWAAHARLFIASGLASWCGLVVVTQNIVGSLFNSHLFDFTQGWIYVFGVGIAGGMVRRTQTSSPVADQPPR